MLKLQIKTVLLHYGITRVYKGFLPLIDLTDLFAIQSFFGPQLLEVVASRHHISVSALRRRIQIIAHALDRRNHDAFCRLNGSGQYRLSQFVKGLASEALKLSKA